jgi:hypothetical protein
LVPYAQFLLRLKMKFPSLFFLLSLFFATQALCKPMTFRLATTGGICFGCTWVDATGEISADTPADFEEFLAAHDFQNGIGYPLLLNSEGGDLGAALELGQRFRELELTVGVAKTTYEQNSDHALPILQNGGVCYSACAYAFLGGKVRNLERGTLGFHQFFDEDILASRNETAFSTVDRLRDHYVVGVLITYIIEMGIDAGFFALYAATPPENMRIITPSEAVEWGVITNSKALKEWGILPLGRGVMLQAESQDASEGVRLFCLRRQPGRMHVQFLFRTEDGQPRLASEEASGNAVEIAEFLPETKGRVGQTPIGLQFERLYDDADYGFDLNFDFTFPNEQLAAFVSAGSVALAPNDSLAYFDAAVVYGFFSRQLPADGSRALFAIAARNCA